jgi:hypothetical protein
VCPALIPARLEDIEGRDDAMTPPTFVVVVVVNGQLVVAVLLLVTGLFWLGDRRLRSPRRGLLEVSQG